MSTSAMLWVSVSNKVCTIGAHLSCYALGVLRVGMVVVISINTAVQ